MPIASEVNERARVRKEGWVLEQPPKVSQRPLLPFEEASCRYGYRKMRPVQYGKRRNSRDEPKRLLVLCPRRLAVGHGVCHG